MNIAARILEAEVSYVPQKLVTPLIISAGAIEKLTEVQARVRVEVDGREAEGIGSVYLSDLLAGPDPALTHKAKQAALRALCDDIAKRLRDYTGGEPAHPLELGLRLYDAV